MLPLTGLKALDSSRAPSAPLSTMIWGDPGAEIVKTKPLRRGYGLIEGKISDVIDVDTRAGMAATRGSVQ